MANESMSARRAALLIHGLDAHARAEVMAKLTPAEVQQVRALLEELEALGIKTHEAASAHTVLSSSDDPLQRVMRMTAESVERYTRSCSAITLTHLIQARRWPWRERIPDLLTGPRRIAVQAHLSRSSKPLSPGVLAALCRELCKQADTYVESADHVEFASFWRNLYVRATRWRR